MAMGFRPPLVCLLFALSAAAVISAAHSAPPPAADCSSLVMNMVDCLSYVSADGSAKKPQGACCSGLKTVLKTDAQCLCQAFQNSAQLGVTLNVTKALTLPAACHLSASSVDNCALSPGIGAAPALSPMAESPSSVAGGPIAGTGATEGAPASTRGNSGSSVLTVPIELLVFTSVAVAVASYALF